MHDEKIPSGLCQCGCGRKTSTARQTDSRNGNVRGMPVRFVLGHGNRRRGVTAEHSPEDRGYVTPCHIWRLSLNGDGYGTTGGGRAYVIAYEAEHGPVPDGLELDHLCGQRDCVRVDHLEAVTHAENCRRGRGAKLTPGEVRAIRASALSQTELGRQFGVNQTTISAILRGRLWRGVGLGGPHG